MSYSCGCELSYAINFRTARTVWHTLVYVHGIRMQLNFVLLGKKYEVYEKNYWQNFLQLQYSEHHTFSLQWLKLLTHTKKKKKFKGSIHSFSIFEFGINNHACVSCFHFSQNSMQKKDFADRRREDRICRVMGFIGVIFPNTMIFFENFFLGFDMLYG